MEKFNNKTLKDAVKEWLDNEKLAESKYGHISNWDTSEVTDMSSLFLGEDDFNEPIGNWDVSNVTSMRSMFYSASSFNQDISAWDMSNVSDMEDMFRDASSFNQNTSSWDTSSWNANQYENPIVAAFYEKIDMAFHWFLKNNPAIEIICDEDTMTQWYDFVKWSYTNNPLSVEEYGEGDIVTEGGYTFKISSLMEKVVWECVSWYDNTRAEDEAKNLTRSLLIARASEVSAKVCDECGGDDDYCEKCYGTGFDVYDKEIDWVYYDSAYRPGIYSWDDVKYDEIHLVHYEEALSKILGSVDISAFEKLSKINL